MARLIEAVPTPDQSKWIRKKIFPGDCYRKAARYLLKHPRCRLVHGTIRHVEGPHAGKTIGHAWIDLGDGKIFDGVLQKFFEKKSYYRFCHAKEERSYDLTAAARMMSKYGIWGPWHRTKGES